MSLATHTGPNIAGQTPGLQPILAVDLQRQMALFIRINAFRTAPICTNPKAGLPHESLAEQRLCAANAKNARLA